MFFLLAQTRMSGAELFTESLAEKSRTNTSALSIQLLERHWANEIDFVKLVTLALYTTEKSSI